MSLFIICGRSYESDLHTKNFGNFINIDLREDDLLFADRICVDEETVRLRAHINHMKDTLASGENSGRKLDFIAQEMNREANTILSKANDLQASNIAIDLKTEIEKVREQIQNIE